MPRLRKYITSKTVIAVTTSLEEGLLLPANSLTQALISPNGAPLQFEKRRSKEETIAQVDAA